MKKLSIGLMVSLTVSCAWAQTVSSDSSLQASSLIDALIKTASRFQLPLAVEWIKSPEALKPIRLSRSDNASEVLDAIISTQGGSAQSSYAWRLEAGIVHVFQQPLVDDPRNPLNVVVDTMPAGRWSVHDADNFLFQAIGQTVRSIGPKAVPIPSPIGNEPQFQIAGGKARVRDFLNRIITASKNKIWIATFPSNLPLTVKGFWEATPAYDSRYVKPEDQPFWILLRWGDSPWKNLESQEN